MGLIDSLKNIYYFFEDKWYNSLDKIDPKIPVYKVIDPIDKVIPSFILFLLLALFVLVFLLYIIKFSSPYDITFSLSDAETKRAISGALIAGTINGEIVSGTTDAEGKTVVTITEIKRNIIESLGAMFFDDTIYLTGIISASKDQYKPITKREIELAKDNNLFLEKLPIQIDLSYPNSYNVRLVDESTNNVIIDNTNASYVKFKCDNKTTSPKRVTDISDALVDGVFKLNDSKCAFIITEAYAPGYDSVGYQITLPLTSGTYDLPLRKIPLQNEGTARISVSKSGSTIGLSGIRIDFHKGGIEAYSMSDNAGIAEKVLESGTYSITVSDANYLPITQDANKTITITNGQISTLSIVLFELPEQDKRIIYFKVLDSIDHNAISNVTVDLVSAKLDANGNYIGVKNDDTIYYSGSTGVTDRNGEFKRTGLSVYDGNIFVVLKKDGFIFKIFKPTLKIVGASSEIVYLVKSSETNSGKANVSVKSTAGKILPSSSTYLYVSGIFDGMIVKNLKLNRIANLTNEEGKSFFSELPSDLNYSASAYFDSSFSGISSSKLLDANKTITFDLNININASFLKISLIDAISLAEITSPADINLYSVNSTTQSLTFVEKLTSVSGIYTSKVYPKSSNLAIKVNLQGFIPNTVYVSGLSTGENNYRIKLYPTTGLETDAEISVFFDDVYGANDKPTSGISSVNTITSGGEFKAKFDIVTNRVLDFNKIFGMVRVSGPIRITDTKIDNLNIYRKEQNSFTCNTQSLDSITGVHDDNYYFPTSCPDTNKIQGGFRWGDANLPIGTYSYIISFSVDANVTDQNIFLNYRAKEINNTTATKKSETKLKSVQFTVDVPFRSGIYFIIKQSGTSFSVQPSSTASTKLSLIPSQENSFFVTLSNQTNKSLTGGKVTVYSYTGSVNYTNSTYSTNPGNIFFDSSQSLSQKEIFQNTSIGALSASQSFNVQAYPKNFNTTEWLVLVAEFSNDSNKYVSFINTKSVGKNLVLRAEFLAGAPDQLFEGSVSDITNSAIPIIKDARIEVYKNCKSTPLAVYNFTLTGTELSNNYFAKTIPGVYSYGVDCVYVTIHADDGVTNVYNAIERQRIMAGSGGSTDPALACVDIEINNSYLTSSLEEELFLDWGDREHLTVENNCTKSVTISIDTGLDCNTASSTFSPSSESCSVGKSINAGEKQNYSLVGKNIDFKETSAPNFSDVLGYYPLNVKAKFSGESNKKFAIAARAHIHLVNQDQCFAISSDYFDFTKIASNRIDFNFTNNCQYVLVGDYFIPSIALSTFGYDANISKTISGSSASFTPIVNITGATFTTTTSNTPYTTYSSTALESIDSTKSYKLPLEDYTHYYDLSFDLSDNADYNVDKLQFRFFDVNNAKLGIDSPYGVAIDGSFIVYYNDGTSIVVALPSNFDINDGVSCVGPNCEVGSDGTDFIFGLFYVNIPSRKGIDHIDFNIIGNNNSEFIELNMRAQIGLTITTTSTSLSSTENTVSHNLTANPITIPALQNIIYIVASVKDLPLLSQTGYTTIQNPKVFISSSNPSVITWIEGDALKATYVGTDYAGFNDGTIEASITKTYGQSISYGTIDVVDYVSESTSGGRTISGNTVD